MIKTWRCANREKTKTPDDPAGGKTELDRKYEYCKYELHTLDMRSETESKKESGKGRRYTVMVKICLGG